MKKSVLKAVFTTSVLLAASGYAALSEAHCIGTLGNFGASGIVTNSPSTLQYDEYKTVCPATTSYLRVRVGKKSGSAPDAATAPITIKAAMGAVFVQTSDNNGITAGTQCDGNGPTGTPNEAIGTGSANTSGWVSRFGGAGTYTITVSKNSAKAMNYAAEFHCHNAAGVELQPTAPSGVGEVDRTSDH